MKKTLDVIRAFLADPNSDPGCLRSLLTELENGEAKSRRFRLRRHEDVSGISGTGIVAEGVEFVNGMVALSWFSPHACVNVYHSLRTVEELHGHQARTEIEWID